MSPKDQQGNVLQVGDEVICVDDSGAAGGALSLGSKYKIARIDSPGDIIIVDDRGNGRTSSWMARRFVLLLGVQRPNGSDLSDRVVKALYDLVNFHKKDKIGMGGWKEWEAGYTVLKELGLELPDDK